MKVPYSTSTLRQYLERIPDQRKARGQRYRLADLLILLILAKLGGQDHMKGIVEWLKLRAHRLVTLLEMPHRNIPHQTTFERVLAKLDIQTVEQAISAYLTQLQGQGICISIDGKTLRGTITHQQPRGVHLLAAYAHKSALCQQSLHLLKPMVLRMESKQIGVILKYHSASYVDGREYKISSITQRY